MKKFCEKNGVKFEKVSVSQYASSAKKNPSIVCLAEVLLFCQNMHAVSSGHSNRSYGGQRAAGGGGGSGTGAGGAKGAQKKGEAGKQQVYRIGNQKITLDGKDGKTLDDIIEVIPSFSGR